MTADTSEAMQRLLEIQSSIRADLWEMKQVANALAVAQLAQYGGQDSGSALGPTGGRVYSQNSEDSCLANIFQRIGAGGRRFLEIGVGDGHENTTRLLLEQGWTGTWVEGDQALASRAAETFRTYVESGSLEIINTLTTSDSANDLSGDLTAVDLISIDIDCNTSHIWRALNIPARVCCVEYNASIPASMAIEMPYEPTRAWDGTNHFGAGLKTLELIGRAKGMSLVSCDIEGVNAYFVADDEASAAFSAPFTAEYHYQPARYNIRLGGHPPAADARAWAVAPEARPVIGRTSA